MASRSWFAADAQLGRNDLFREFGALTSAGVASRKNGIVAQEGLDAPGIP